jgi:hypothetical protein
MRSEGKSSATASAVHVRSAVRPAGQGDDVVPELQPVGSGVYGLRNVLRTEPRRGRKVLGAVVAATFVFPALLALGFGTFGVQWFDQPGVHRAARADRFVQESLAAVAAFPFATVARFDGQAWHDQATPQTSDFRIELKVQPSSESLLQVDAVLKDARTSRELARHVTFRDRR